MKKLLKIIATSVLSVLACATLFACVPSNIEKAEKKMAKEGYDVKDIGKLGDGCVGGISARKADLQDGIDFLIAYLFESNDDAKDFLADWEELVGNESGTAIRDGKWVYAGTEDAIEDFED